jgi:hypothetical protein
LLGDGESSPGALCYGKTTQRLLAGCVPIYYGTRQVLDVFHPDSFVFYEVHKPQEALGQVAAMESNPKLYQAMMNAPILKEGAKTIDKYFSIFPNIGDGRWNQEIRSMMGIPHISQMQQ